jgi:hypothetical protein
MSQQESQSPKKSYEELVKALNQKITPHFLFVISEIHKKLISLSNTNVQNEIVSQSSSTNTDKNSSENKIDKMGK